MNGAVSHLDWAIIAVYLIAVVGLGVAAGFLRCKGERGGATMAVGVDFLNNFLEPSTHPIPQDKGKVSVLEA